ncbi:hypothetical protein AB0M46_30675 [Dactylosporangium sp. NPDC051485]|uniref:DUF2207 family protein n=1 Tax=Dactylosporangium sp. NPDC051485 TaxID=3154846 RepID=UPI0034257194
MDWPPFLQLSVPVTLAVWVVVTAVTLWRSRTRLPEAGPALTTPPGEEPPAVVSLMVNRWRSDEDAIDSTLLDLAARGFLELRQPGDDPAETTVRLRKGDGRSLTPYEQQVLDRVQKLAVGGEASLTSLAFRSWSEARRWRGAFYREVIEEARTRGLSRPRLSRRIRHTLLGAALVPAACMFASWMWVATQLHAGLSDQITGSLIGAGAVFLVMYFVVELRWSDRNTPQGMRVAAEWLAYRAHLVAMEGVTDLAPADVASWGREMAFASALGVLPTEEALMRSRVAL